MKAGTKSFRTAAASQPREGASSRLPTYSHSIRDRAASLSTDSVCLLRPISPERRDAFLYLEQ